MSGDAEVYIEADRTRVVSNIDVSTDRNSDPAISLQPRQPRISVNAQSGSVDGTLEVKNAAGSETIADLTAHLGSGYFTVTGTGGGTSAALHASQPTPAVDVPRSSTPTTHVEAGRIDIRASLQLGYPVLEAHDSGSIIFRNDDDLDTVHLDAATTTLTLRGSPEINPARDNPSPTHDYGGGELVVASHGDPDDIHLHAKGEQASDYGTDNNDNRPRITLNGPTATLDLGRHTLGSDRIGVPGTIRLRDEQAGATVLELAAEQYLTSDFISREFGEVELSYYDAPKLRHRGTIRAHQDGVMIYDAGENPALLLTPSGDMLTRHSVRTDPTL